MEWNIQSRTHVCHVSGERFQDGDAYHTVLLDAGKDGFQRLDVSQPVWDDKFEGRAQDEKGYISHWCGTYRVPPPPPPDAIEKENAETLLQRLVQLNDSRYRGAVYILAVMLERKRILKIQNDLKKDGERIFIYEHSKSKDIYPIAEVSLGLDELNSVQQQVADLLEHGLNDDGLIAYPEPAEAEPVQAGPSEPDEDNSTEEAAEFDESSPSEK